MSWPSRADDSPQGQRHAEQPGEGGKGQEQVERGAGLLEQIGGLARKQWLEPRPDDDRIEPVTLPRVALSGLNDVAERRWHDPLGHGRIAEEENPVQMQPLLMQLAVESVERSTEPFGGSGEVIQPRSPGRAVRRIGILDVGCGQISRGAQLVGQPIYDGRRWFGLLDRVESALEVGDDTVDIGARIAGGRGRRGRSRDLLRGREGRLLVPDRLRQALKLPVLVYQAGVRSWWSCLSRRAVRR